MSENVNAFIEQQVAAFLGKSEIDWEKLKPIICFVVLWNRLEVMHNQSLGLRELSEKAEQVASSSAFDLSRYDDPCNFFWRRYTINPHAFNSLFRADTRNNEILFEDLLRKWMRGESLTSVERLKAILYIPYRIRNNLFHGRKDTLELYDQVDLFTQVNEILCLFYADLCGAR